MPDLRITPIGQADQQLLLMLMGDEIKVWLGDLGWDYTPVSSILATCVRQNILPGFVATISDQAVGYCYFLIHEDKGIIGTIYAPKSDDQQQVADTLLSHCIRSLKESIRVRRIEAQIMPFHEIRLTTGFTRHGFEYFPRYFMELDLDNYAVPGDQSPGTPLIPWDSTKLPFAAAVVERSYRGEADAQICEDYCSVAGCESYLRSLIENPGCGSFLSDASFMGLNAQGIPCGFIISSKIATSSGMVPQIAIDPDYQGRGLGNSLMRRALTSMQAVGMRSVGLTVTKKNRRAFEWYQRLGFKLRKEFGAFVWDRG
jgi:ribosomal protein S18 acetylase RimI-like enzyme